MTSFKTAYYDITFQEKPISEVGVNGCQPEDIIDVLLSHLTICQAGLPCRETALAITKLQEAMFWLEHRRRLRATQKVEGTNQPHLSVGR